MKLDISFNKLCIANTTCNASKTDTNQCLMEGCNQRKHFSKIHWENYISFSFHIEWDMIVETVFLSILNQMELHLLQIERKIVITTIYPIRFERKWKYSFLSAEETFLKNKPSNDRHCYHCKIPWLKVKLWKMQIFLLSKDIIRKCVIYLGQQWFIWKLLFLGIFFSVSGICPLGTC